MALALRAPLSGTFGIDWPIFSVGFGDAAGVARAIGLGAQGVSLGTRFVACDEAYIHEDYKRRIVESNAADTVITADLYHVGWPDAPHRVLREVPSIWHDAKVFDLEVPGGSLVVWTSPYAPFFGDEELALLRTVGALTGLALERANEVKSNFVALAAHELRTPMTTIHGFVTTLHHLSDRLEDEQREQVREALLQQTHRMAALIEQLLDLSRLDAEAIDIIPEPIRVRDQISEIVAAVADRAALERIVSNLVTNAFRYGTPPVTVRAVQTDRHFRLSVEDHGTGVAAEFVPDLFERFSRSEGSRADTVGTGLGLAIAQSYARAHGGDLLYEDATPHGARFLLVLPSQPRQDASLNV